LAYKWPFCKRFSSRIMHAFLTAPILAMCPHFHILLYVTVLIVLGDL
jgi:hypothetical protein